MGNDTVSAALDRMRNNLRRRLTKDEKVAIDAYTNVKRDLIFGFIMNRILRSELDKVPPKTVDEAKRHIAKKL